MEITISYAVLLALTMGAVEAVKRIGLNSKFLPIFAIIFGWALCAIARMPFTELVVGGLMIGLGSVGLYSGVKNTIK